MTNTGGWTVAYRALLPEPEPVFHRVDLDLTWRAAAHDVATELGEILGSAFEVWYTTTRAEELTERVSREDVLNILVDDDVRVPIVDDGRSLEEWRSRLAT